MKDAELKNLIAQYAKHQAAGPVALAQVTDDIWSEIQAISDTREAAKDRASKLVSPRPGKRE